MRDRWHSTIAAAWIAAGLGLVGVGAAAAQPRFQYVGPKQCTNCHDHDAEKQWYEKQEIPEVHRLFPDQNNAGHINSLKQLETPKSDEFAKAVGLADKYDSGGLCVTCHATVFNGEANAGVSCESCHGPGSGYKDPHQVKDSYDKSVAEFGMTRLVGNFAGWTQQCTNCHVMTEAKLIAAGHPSGDDFDLSKKYAPVSLHFKKKYTADEVAAVARGEMQAVLRRRGRPAPTATTTPEAGAGAVPAATAPPSTGAAGAPTAAPSPAAPATGASPPPTAPSSRASSSAAASSAAASGASPAATPSTVPGATPRPRSAARPTPIDPAAPPAGSPTSIEPPPPVADASAAGPAAPPPTSAPPAPAPTPAPRSAGTEPPGVAFKTSYVDVPLGIGIGLVFIVVAIVVVVLRKRR